MTALALIGAVALAEPLHLDDVLEAVARHPKVEAARAGVDGAAGRRLQAEGAFDLTVTGGVGGAPVGKHQRFGATLGVEQPLATIGGPRLFASYRNGGDHPLYDGKRVTSTFGELGAGLRIDLLRDLFIDPERAALEQRRLEQAAAVAEQEQVFLAVQAEAADVFWRWAAAGEELIVERQLRAIAEQRQVALKAQVERGLLPPIVLDDNRRLVQHRKERVARAELALVAAANELSLYLRDDAGRPVVPGPERLAPLPAARAPAGPSLQDALDQLPRALPLLRAYEATRESALVEARIARSDSLPRMTLDLGVYQDVGERRRYGDERTSNQPEVFSQLSVAWPVQRREARGREQAVRAAVRAIDEEARLWRDGAEAAVKTAWAGLEAALRRADFAAEAVKAAARLERAERRRFEVGAGDLLALNLREHATAGERRSLIEARADVQRAWARFLTAQGRPPGVS